MPRTTALLLFVTAALLSAPSAGATVPRLLGTVPLSASDRLALPKWERVLRRIESERPVYRRCAAGDSECPDPLVREWQQLLNELRDQPRARQLEAVNRFANRNRYIVDPANYGVNDYWASPLEFLDRSGDCEDYAIFKYVSLRALGVPDEEMRIVVLRDTERGIDHAVLAVHLGGRVLILDNVTDSIRPDGAVPQYRPYYSVNATKRWVHVPSATPRPAGGGSTVQR